MKNIKVLLAIVAAGFAGFAHAGIEQGDVEIGISLTVSEPDEGEGNTFIIGSYGYNVTQNLQILGAGFIGESGGTEFGNIGAGVDYLFGNADSNVVPFVGGSYQLSIGDFDETDFFDIHAGLKQFIGERASIDYQIQRLEATDSDFSDFGQTNLTIGINFYF